MEMKLLDSDQAMTGAELAWIEVSQTGRAEHLQELEPGTEHLGISQRRGGQRPESLLHGFRGISGGSSGDDRICDDHGAHPVRRAQPGTRRHGDLQGRRKFSGHPG